MRQINQEQKNKCKPKLTKFPKIIRKIRNLPNTNSSNMKQAEKQHIKKTKSSTKQLSSNLSPRITQSHTKGIRQF